MHIEKIMGPPPPTIRANSSVKEVSELLLKHASNSAIVLNEKKKAVGLITNTDIINHIAHFGKTNTTIASIMSTPVLTVQASQTISEVLKQIDTNHLRKYPVMRHNTVVGSISDKELILSEYNTIRLHRAIQNGVLIFFLLFELLVFFVILRGAQ